MLEPFPLPALATNLQMMVMEEEGKVHNTPVKNAIANLMQMLKKLLNLSQKIQSYNVPVL
jgi:hypothetical protein